MSLRVAVVALYPLPGAKAPGGVRAVVQNLVQGLKAYPDLRMDIIHCHSDIAYDQLVESDGTAFHYIAMPRARVMPNTLASIGRVESLLRRIVPDVVNTHAAHYTVAALRAQFPTVYTIHGVIHREAQVYRSRLFDRLRFLLEEACERYALSRVREIVAISPYVLDEYSERSKARFHRVDNPLPERFFTLPNNREESGRLLFAGTIDERKDVIGLLQAIDLVRRRVVGVRLRIAGRSTQPQYLEHVRRLVATLDLGEHVSLLGLLESEAMLEEYARCAAVVLASHQETAPMAVTEAMAAGKPVVATSVGGVPDLVEDGGSGLLVEAGDPTALADALVRLLDDHELRSRMGARGRVLAQRFRVDRIAAQYRELFYDVAGKVGL